MKKNKKVVYYQDEKNDDFFNMNKEDLKQVDVDRNYNYLPKSFVFKFLSFIFYYIIALPLLTVANLVLFRTRTKGRKNIKNLKNQGFFVYANHTNYKDAWVTPISVARFRKNYVIAEKTAVRIRFVGQLVKAGGGLPVADTPTGLKNLSKAIETIINKKQIVTIFPEAHIWPYYTGVRPFPSTSFRFAAKTGAPAVPVAIAYKQKWFLGDIRKPRQVVYIGKPVFPKPELSVKENAEYLNQQCHEFIRVTLEAESTYSYVEYVKQNQEAMQLNLIMDEEEKEAVF